MDSDRFLWLLSKELQGTIGPEERAALEIAAANDPELATQRKLLHTFWQDRRPEQDPGRYTRQAFETLVQRIQHEDAAQWPDDPTVMLPAATPAIRRPFRRMLKVAAIALLLGGVTYVAARRFGREKAVPVQSMASKHNSKGSRSRITLTDGTRVWLNADSELKFPESFEGPVREVFLTGEAFFEVAQDAEHPFLINTDRMKIRVLGTSFNVRSYPGDATHETTLLTGAIEVTLKDRPEATIRLKPKEKLVIPNGPDTAKGQQALPPRLMISTPTYLPAADSIMVETGWIENRLTFNAEPFESLARRMERWYNIKIEFRNREVEQLTFTGLFRNESLEKALKALQLTEPFHYKIENDHVIIY